MATYVSATDDVTQIVQIPARSTGAINLTQVLLWPANMARVGLLPPSGATTLGPARRRSKCDLGPVERRRRKARRKATRLARKRNRLG